MKINGNELHSAQKYVEMVTGEYMLIDNMEKLLSALKSCAFELICLDDSTNYPTTDFQLLYYTSLCNMQNLFNKDDCKDREFVLVETFRNDESEKQECFICEVPSVEKTFTITLEETSTEDVEITAKTVAEARKIAQQMYKDCEFGNDLNLQSRKLQVYDHNNDFTSSWEEF